MERRRKNGIYPMAVTAAMAAVMAVISPFALPIGPVPISLCTLVIFLAVYVLGWKRGTAATLVYVLLGAAGMPVFSGFGGGMGKVLGPTGGYILGYLALALIAGAAVERFPKSRAAQLAGMTLGTAVLYSLGTAWFCFQSGYVLGAALGLCVFPFLPGDLAKIGAALVMGPSIRDRLERAGLLPEN